MFFTERLTASQQQVPRLKPVSQKSLSPREQLYMKKQCIKNTLDPDPMRGFRDPHQEEEVKPVNKT